MSCAAVTFVTYVWHYVVARLLYDHLVRPLLQGRVTAIAMICAIAVAAFAIGWWSGRGRVGPRRRA